MTNYMGKRRLLKIMLQMLSDRPELQAQVKKERDFLKYTTYRGYELLKFCTSIDGRTFKICTDGPRAKVVHFEEYSTNEYGDVLSLYNGIDTIYDENFEPFPLETWFSGGCEQRRLGYFPFHDGLPSDVCPVPDGLNPDMFVCYDIAKQAVR